MSSDSAERTSIHPALDPYQPVTSTSQPTTPALNRPMAPDFNQSAISASGNLNGSNIQPTSDEQAVLGQLTSDSARTSIAIRPASGHLAVTTSGQATTSGPSQYTDLIIRTYTGQPPASGQHAPGHGLSSDLARSTSVGGNPSTSVGRADYGQVPAPPALEHLTPPGQNAAPPGRRTAHGPLTVSVQAAGFTPLQLSRLAAQAASALAQAINPAGASSSPSGSGQRASGPPQGIVVASAPGGAGLTPSQLGEYISQLRRQRDALAARTLELVAEREGESEESEVVVAELKRKLDEARKRTAELDAEMAGLKEKEKLRGEEENATSPPDAGIMWDYVVKIQKLHEEKMELEAKVDEKTTGQLALKHWQNNKEEDVDNVVLRAKNQTLWETNESLEWQNSILLAKVDQVEEEGRSREEEIPALKQRILELEGRNGELLVRGDEEKERRRASQIELKALAKEVLVLKQRNAELAGRNEELISHNAELMAKEDARKEAERTAAGAAGQELPESPACTSPNGESSETEQQLEGWGESTAYMDTNTGFAPYDAEEQESNGNNLGEAGENDGTTETVDKGKGKLDGKGKDKEGQEVEAQGGVALSVQAGQGCDWDWGIGYPLNKEAADVKDTEEYTPSSCLGG